MTKEKKTYLLKYAGQQQRFAQSVVAGDFVFLRRPDIRRSLKKYGLDVEIFQQRNDIGL